MFQFFDKVSYVRDDQGNIIAVDRVKDYPDGSKTIDRHEYVFDIFGGDGASTRINTTEIDSDGNAVCKDA